MQLVKQIIIFVMVFNLLNSYLQSLNQNTIAHHSQNLLRNFHKNKLKQDLLCYRLNVVGSYYYYHVID